MVNRTVKHLPTRSVSQSAVNIRVKEFPCKSGNYFEFQGWVLCLNMWAENFREAVKRFSLEKIECIVYESGDIRMAFVTDPAIPAEWLHDHVCTTGSILPREFIETLCAHQGIAPVDRLCGCEAPEQAPDLVERWDLASRKKTFRCYLCGRIETVDFKNSTR